MVPELVGAAELDPAEEWAVIAFSRAESRSRMVLMGSACGPPLLDELAESRGVELGVDEVGGSAEDMTQEQGVNKKQNETAKAGSILLRTG